MGGSGKKWWYVTVAALISAVAHVGLLEVAPHISLDRLTGGTGTLPAVVAPAAPLPVRRLNVRLVDVRDRIFKIRNPSEDEARTAATVGAELDQRARLLFESLGLTAKPKPEARLEGLGAAVPPPKLTAATGMDAIAHCMETFMSAAINPPADGIALDGLERGWAHIERATRDLGSAVITTWRENCGP